jgi:glucose-1-phosphate adenylyltransferase
MAHLFSDSCVTSGLEDEPYWRDVGTIDAFWQANIDLTDFKPKLDLYDTLADLDLCRGRAAGQVHP